jgi:hypothetical protein
MTLKVSSFIPTFIKIATQPTAENWKKFDYHEERNT